MDKNQGIALPCRDHFCGNNGLAECRSRCKHPGFMLEKSRGGRTLFRRWLAEKPCGEELSLLALVAQFGGNADAAKKAH